MYRRLDSTKIIETLAEKAQEVDARFPESSIWKVSAELLAMGREAQDRADWITKPLYALRFFKFIAILALIGLAAAPFWAIEGGVSGELGFWEIVQVEEAAINVMIVVGAAILFLINLEKRIKRHRALEALHELRAIAHVIDMHQIPKDPEKVLGGVAFVGDEDRLEPGQLIEYLDCCADLLALIGKVAALYVQNFEDEVALAAVNEIEQLTTALSRKIWQKISVVHQLMHA